MNNVQGPLDKLEMVPWRVCSSYWAVSELPVSVSLEPAGNLSLAVCVLPPTLSPPFIVKVG
jgi:hypothetical protein